MKEKKIIAIFCIVVFGGQKMLVSCLQIQISLYDTRNPRNTELKYWFRNIIIFYELDLH